MFTYPQGDLVQVSRLCVTLRDSERGNDLPKIKGQILAENFMV